MNRLCKQGYERDNKGYEYTHIGWKDNGKIWDKATKLCNRLLNLLRLLTLWKFRVNGIPNFSDSKLDYLLELRCIVITGDFLRA